jgi:hypothetical protein
MRLRRMLRRQKTNKGTVRGRKMSKSLGVIYSLLTRTPNVNIFSLGKSEPANAFTVDSSKSDFYAFASFSQISGTFVNENF